MNYRHAFHSGNFADVHKHVVLCLLVQHLKRKETPFAIFDSHAGAGLYDLASDEAVRTGEADKGVRMLTGAGFDAPGLAEYLAMLRAFNPGWPEIRTYPGSPEIARRLLRPNDRLIASEKHPVDSKILRRSFAHDRRVQVHEADGYETLIALSPPKERRGLALIDPSFEAADEFNKIAAAMNKTLARWPSGILAIWYPIKDHAQRVRLLSEIAGLGRPCLTSELRLPSAQGAARLVGSGLAIVNPPWQFDRALEEAMAALRNPLGATEETCVRWMVEPI
jgi:23S rRNA (adenine2030-N6)-methyltransferase